MFESIRSKHTSSGRLYPRPSLDCPDCGRKVILCWGAKSRTHIRHLKSSDSNGGCALKKGGGEALIHQFAKVLIRNFIRDGGQISFERSCTSCRRVFSGVLPVGKECELEVAIEGGSLFDVGVFNQGSLLSGIEIKYTHLTENVVFRNVYPWIEVDALEVLTKLDVAGVRDVKLRCLRTDERCEECDSNGEVGVIVPLSSSYSPSPAKIEKQEKGEKREKSKEEFKNQLSAITFGYCYYVTEEDNLHSKILNVINDGVYIKPYDRPCWTVKYRPDTEFGEYKLKKEWSNFIRRGLCIRCSQLCEVKMYSPFCERCVHSITFLEKKSPEKLIRHEHATQPTMSHLSYAREIKARMIALGISSRRERLVTLRAPMHAPLSCDICKKSDDLVESISLDGNVKVEYGCCVKCFYTITQDADRSIW